MIIYVHSMIVTFPFGNCFRTYVKYCKLQDPEQKTQINCDEKMFAVFQKRRIDQKEMMSMLKKNMS